MLNSIIKWMAQDISRSKLSVMNSFEQVKIKYIIITQHLPPTKKGKKTKID